MWPSKRGAWGVCSLMLGVGLMASSGGRAQGDSLRDATVHPDRWPSVASPLQRDGALERRIIEWLAKLSVEEKVGQVVQADIGSVTPDDVRKYRLGSILAGGNSDPGGKYNATPAQWLALADAFHAASMDTEGGHAAIPILFGIDAVHGHNNVVGATLYPHNIGLGATRNPELLRRIAQATAAEIRATGAEWTFAPTLTVPRDDRWGRTYEGYSEDPVLVASYAAAVVEGLQGKAGSPEFLDGRHVAASAKHFLGDGGTDGGKDQGDARIGEAELRDVHGAGYPPAIAAGAQTVMASFSSWNGAKMHGNRALLTDVLKGRMGFDGFVVGDWNAHGQLPGCSNENCAAALNAGIDMLMTPDTWRGYYDNTLAQVRSGAIPMARLDDAVARILRVKLRLGLFEAAKPSQRVLGGKFELVGAPAHRALARQAVRESLVLLKNHRRLLPIDPKSNVLVAGDGADDIARQSGGWTLSWQGTGTTPADFPNAQSIWAGLRQQIEAANGTATLSPDGRYTRRPDVAIVVFGEDPYAEFQGDIATLAYKPGDDRDLDLIRRLKADGIPVAAVFLSGRPLWMNREINAANAFVAAWLPGSEGGGIADVLLRTAAGAVAHDFKGKLAYSWPRNAVQTPLNVGQPGYDPQFAYGFGLTYADAGDLAPLPEISGVTGAQSAAGVFFARGQFAEGWRARLDGTDGQAVDAGVATSETGDRSLRMAPSDHQAQEDARRLSWSGTGEAGIALIAPAALDLSRETNGDVLLVLTAKVDAAPAAPVALDMGCGEGCTASIALQESLASLAGKDWQRLGVPLKCFRDAGADMARIEQPFALRTSGELVLQVSRVALATVADVLVGCAKP